MRALDLDYQRSGVRSPWAAWVLLALAVAFAADLAVNYFELTAQLQRDEARVARLARSQPVQSVGQTDPNAMEKEFLYARDTINRLALPWGRLFKSLESAQTEGLALLSIEPDSEAGTVVLSGEGKDYLAVLTYVAWLRSDKTLTDVHLVKHEIQVNKPQRPVSFMVSAAWSREP